MGIDDEMMSAEEFFAEHDEVFFGKGHPRPTRRVGNGKGKDSLSEAKERLVMRIYGVSRAKAREIIAKRQKKADAGEQPESRTAPSSRNGGDKPRFLEFFGEV